MTVTAILLNYQRQPNLRVIIPALRAQAVQPRIVLVNNGQPYTTETPEQAPDELWTPPRNIGPFARFLAAYAYDGWLYFQDDDLVPADTGFLADLLALAQQRPNAITGVWGRHIPDVAPHYKHPDSHGPTNMVKTICMMMRRETLGRVRFPPCEIGRNDDIWVSLESSGGESLHYSGLWLADRLRRLPEWGVGLSHERGHYDEREAFCAAWWKGCHG